MSQGSAGWKREDLVMTTTQTNSAPLEEPLAELERRLISEFVSAAGQDLHALLMRHDDEAKKLLTEASLYASARLTEVESRSHYLRKLHGEP
jgi:hypothetical protein